jgi:AraC family transcriptional regulator
VWPVNRTLQQVQQAIALIEARLFEAVTLAELAAEVHSSPWHFQRVFSAVTGQSPAGYARKRRFSELCARVVQTRLPMLQIALEGGFESQAAFTRAFTRYTGVSPGRYRKGAVTPGAHHHPAFDMATLIARNRSPVMQPRIQQQTAFHIIGMSAHITDTTTSHIPELWTRLLARSAGIEQRIGKHMFGLCIDTDAPHGDAVGITYVAALQVERIGAVPAGMVAMTIPSSRYAVFTHHGHVSRISDTCKLAFARWLPEAQLQPKAASDLELYEYYDERFDAATSSGDIDLYIPIADEA